MSKINTPAKPPAPPPQPADPGQPWAEDSLLRLDAWKNFRNYFRPPPPDVSTADLTTVKRVVDPDAAQPGRLLPSLLPELPQTWHDATGRATDVTMTDDRSAVHRLTGRMAGSEASERLRSILLDLHAGIDQGLPVALRRGDGVDTLLLTDATSSVGRHVEPHWLDSRAAWVMVLAIEHLPAGHVVLGWPAEIFYRRGEQRLIVLGRPSPTHLPDQHARPRTHYSLAHARRLTVGLRARQLRDQLDHLIRPDPADYERLMAEWNKLESLAKQRPAPAPEPPPIADARPWHVRLVEAAGWLSDPSRCFRAPPPDASAASLLRVRSAIGWDDDAVDPSRSSAADLAGLVAGESRRQDLLGALIPLLSGIDRLLAARLEQGLLWAAGQADATRPR